MNFFTRELNKETVVTDLLENVNDCYIAEFCHPLSINDKKNCKTCQNPCLFRIDEILNPKCSLSQTDILKELSFHNHPRSRLLTNIDGTKRQRITTKAARELANHYKFAHNKKEPDFS